MVPMVAGTLKGVFQQLPSASQLSGKLVKLLANNPLTSVGAGMLIGGGAWSARRHYEFQKGKLIEKEASVLVGRGGEPHEGALGMFFNALHGPLTSGELEQALGDLYQTEAPRELRKADLLKKEVQPLVIAWETLLAARASGQEREIAARLADLLDALAKAREDIQTAKCAAFKMSTRWGSCAVGELEARKVKESTRRVALPAFVGCALFAVSMLVRMGSQLKGFNVRWLR